MQIRVFLILAVLGFMSYSSSYAQTPFAPQDKLVEAQHLCNLVQAKRTGDTSVVAEVRSELLNSQRSLIVGEIEIDESLPLEQKIAQEIERESFLEGYVAAFVSNYRDLNAAILVQETANMSRLNIVLRQYDKKDEVMVKQNFLKGFEWRVRANLAFSAFKDYKGCP